LGFWCLSGSAGRWLWKFKSTVENDPSQQIFYIF
jgi:hypothetical protein